MSPSESFKEIPRIDLSFGDDPACKAQLLSQLRYALVDVGFLYIENHGVPQHVVTNLRDALPALFSLPAKIKEDLALGNSPHFLGYSADGSEITAGQPDRREQFEFANELTATWAEGKPLSERLRGPNQVSRQDSTDRAQLTRFTVAERISRDSSSCRGLYRRTNGPR